MFLQSPEFYLLRTPVNTINRLSATKDKSADNLLETFSVDPVFMEGLFVASPELYHSYQKYLLGDSLNPAAKEKLFNAVYKYFIRYCSKSTPFGLFAGFAYGVFVNEENIKLKKPHQHTRSLRLDMSYVVALCDALGRMPQIREQVKYYPNNTSYKLEDKLFYIDFSVDEFIKTYRLSSVDASEYLEGIAAICKKGSPLEGIYSFLEEKGISHPQAVSYVDELIDNKILLSELEPTVVGLNNLDKVISIVCSFKGIDHIKDILSAISHLMLSSGDMLTKSQEVKKLLSELIVVDNDKNLFQLDLELETASNKISRETIDRFRPELEAVFLALAYPYKNSRLEEFKRAYLERYEGNEMPLSQVLDPVYGLGYDPESSSDEVDDIDLIKDLPAGTPQKKEHQTDRLSELRLKKLAEALKYGRHSVTVTAEELTQLKQDIPYNKLPESFYIAGSLIKINGEENSGYKLSLPLFIGSSGANLLNRFASASPANRQKIKRYIKVEESFQKEKIYAEIVHLPQPRIGNVLLRPSTRAYEIPYLGASNLPADNQILISDLLVSINKGKVVLRSIKHNREVLPKLTTAHMYMTGLNVYKFLGDVQKQDVYDYYTWDWKELTNHEFLPRIETRSIILSPARWRISREMVKANTSVAEFAEKLRAITPVLPRWFFVIEVDLELLIDLENGHSLGILLNLLQKYPKLELKECTQDPENSLATSALGGHFHEFIIPYHKIPLPIPENVSLLKKTSRPASINIPMAYALGSEWLFLKIYCGTETADFILNALRPYIEKWLHFGIIDKWFFIRYHDPGYHLRIRFHSHLVDFYGFIIRDINQLIQPLTESGKVASLVTGNYVREIARYGAENMNSFEELSFWDSMTVVNVLYQLKKNTQEHLRWLLILKNIDALLNDLGFDLHQKLEYVKRYKTGLFNEINADNSLNKELNMQYRQRDQQVSSFLDGKQDKQNGLLSYTRYFKKRAQQSRKYFKEIMANEKKSGNQYLKEIQFGIIHLSINRLCKSAPRQHELVFYHHLEVYYTIQINKQKSNKKADATAYGTTIQQPV
ncbi:MAG: Lantibiotic dehydratase domain protein [Mucilaginibacter sp.]|nr:Lantibiotic dehydratase domain protein [Mucilaginibacter sp.]